MIFKFDSEYLLKNELTPNQFFVMQLALEMRQNYLSRYEEFMKEDIEILVRKGYLRKVGKRYKPTPSYMEKFSEKDSFQELLDTYPMSVIRPDGKKTYLRVDRTRSEKAYRKITRGRRDVHEYILDCLKFEVEKRKKENSLQWMKTLPNWIASEGWVEWGERKKEESLNNLFEIKKPTMGYGTEIE